MNTILDLRRKSGTTQQELATMAGTSQSTIAAYEKGTKSPTLRTLENLARSQGLEMVVNYQPLMSREDKRSLAFHHAIVVAIKKDPTEVLNRARQNLQKLTEMHPGAANLFKIWRKWLALPLEDLIENMLDFSPEAREMRQVSPFSGILNPQQRLRVLQQFRQDFQA